MTSDLVEKLMCSPGVQSRPQAPESSLLMHVPKLPSVHALLLSQSNGLSCYGNYFRLFGVTAGDVGQPMDLDRWNSAEMWKFAWPVSLAEYLCFGETAWGDQYAYRIDELGRADPPVYFMEAITLQPEPLAESFEEFISEELLRNCEEPYDDMLVAARRKVGDLADEDHIAYVPSPLIAGDESIDHVVKMNAIAAMIANGDLAAQLTGENQSRQIAGLQPYTDPQGRPRLKVIWCT